MADIIGKPPRSVKKHKYQNIYDDLQEMIDAYQDDKWFGYKMPDELTADRARVTASGYLSNSDYRPQRWNNSEWLDMRSHIEKKDDEIILWLKIVKHIRRFGILSS